MDENENLNTQIAVQNEPQNVNPEEKPGFYSKKFKTIALKQLNGRWTMPVIITLIVTAVTTVLTCIAFPWNYYIETLTAVINGTEPDVSSFPLARYVIMMFLMLIITPVIELAQLYTFPVLFKSKEPVKFSDFITGFSFWGKAFGIFWWQFLWLFLWGLLGMLIGFVGGGVIGVIVTAIGKTGGSSMSAYTSGTLVGSLVPFGGYIGLAVVEVIKAYEYSMAKFAIVDNPKVGITQSLDISKKLTKGYKWKLFCLDLSFIGWAILASLVYIGNLWLTPYEASAKYAAFQYLLEDYNKRMQEKAEQEKKTEQEN